MLQTAENREHCKAELLLRFALYEQSKRHTHTSEELLRMDFRDVARELTGSDSFIALAEYFNLWQEGSRF